MKRTHLFIRTSDPLYKDYVSKIKALFSRVDERWAAFRTEGKADWNFIDLLAAHSGVPIPRHLSYQKALAVLAARVEEPILRDPTTAIRLPLLTNRELEAEEEKLFLYRRLMWELQKTTKMEEGIAS